jgi:hypothetical protein
MASPMARIICASQVSGTAAGLRRCDDRRRVYLQDAADHDAIGERQVPPAVKLCPQRVPEKVRGAACTAPRQQKVP